MGEGSTKKDLSMRTLVTGSDIRRTIRSHAAAFLEPEAHEPEVAFRALVIVMHAYALGSRTAHDLMRERARRCETWTVPSRDEALRVILYLSSVRKYLPYLLGGALST